MYSSRGNNAYGQQQQPKPQSYSGQSALGQNLGSEGASQMSMASRHSALLGGHPSAGAHYGGQYTSVYGSTTLNSALQVPATSAKGAGSSVLEGRSGYGSTMQDSPKYTPGDYPKASQKYGQKGEKTFSDKLTDYTSGDRLPYADRPSAYSGRDLPNESNVRFTDSIAFGHQHKPDIYDRLDAAAALRQELLHSQSLQSASVDGSSRQADYLAARAATIGRAGQELLPYGGRMDTDLHTLSMISGTQHAPSILGAAPRRDVEDLLYAHGSANPGYGVSLPPGRAYASGKGLHGTPLVSDYPGGILSRGGYARLDDRKDDLEYAREIELREEDRRREILRERERDRERERQRERERERERRRERERILERREKERDRRERTPLRLSRDRGGSLSAKAGRSSRRDSPRIDASHRRHSPVKEIRREYVCKVYPSNLVDVERDYLSMDKRYPKLFILPECSKVVVNWSRGDLKIPFRTPISFEHDFVQEETPTEPGSSSTEAKVEDHVKGASGTTRWNAKMLLMSGLSHNAWEELSSDRNYEDRIPHLCNMLRFAFLKDENSYMAIGGSWDSVDGNDPSVDKSTLHRTVLRYAKELTGLDLKNCQHWNPFLEIHYERVGKDGFFSHNEVTVLYIPDLSGCLPSIDAWRDQWLAHKKAIAERERLHALKREKLREKKEGSKDKDAGTTKDSKKVEKTEKKKDGESASKANGKEKVGTKVNKSKEAGKEGDKTINEKKEGVDDGNSSGKKNEADKAGVQTSGSGKKKVVRKVVKKKVVPEKDGAEDSHKQNDDTLDSKNVEKTSENKEVIEDAEPSATTSTKKKTIKKPPVAVDTVQKEAEVKDSECSDEKPKNADVVGASVKTTVKKKIVKKVAKRKLANNKDKVANESEEVATQTAASGNLESEVKPENNESVSEVVPQGEQKEVGGSNESGNKSENNQVKEEKKAKVENGSDKNEKSKERKEKKDKDGKSDTKVKDVKDKKKTEEVPRHPGLFLTTKGSKSSKLRSLSLSLDSLLDYTDKDIEESTFELSLFAEIFYEMLQYQMGSRILAFLQKLRIKFVAKRNQKKRQREQVSDKKEKEKTSSVKKSSPKRLKTEDVSVERKSIKTETSQEGDPVDEKFVVKEENMIIDNVENTKTEADNVENIKTEDESEKEEDPDEDPEEEEDPDEDPEEDETMEDASHENDAEKEEKEEVDKVDMDVKSEKVDEKLDEKAEEKVKVTASPDTKSQAEKKESPKLDPKKKETSHSINKELLQAFRFFDRNRVGYIRVEDLRLILHALGKFMSHRDVKELVQSALLESSTGRDDRILYNKLVKMTDI